MIYQVRADILFASEDEARDFYHDCELALPKGTVINPESDNIEFSVIERIDNNHDSDPNQPCNLAQAASNEPEQ